MKRVTNELAKLVPTVFALAPLFLLAACVTDPTADNIRFGESVRHMITLQTADPQSGAAGLDGEKAEEVIRAYRADVAKPEATERRVIELDF